jgi:hypothetical protein
MFKSLEGDKASKSKDHKGYYRLIGQRSREASRKDIIRDRCPTLVSRAGHDRARFFLYERTPTAFGLGLTKVWPLSRDPKTGDL